MASRKRGTKVSGSTWTPEEIEAVWKKGQTIAGEDAAKVRMDWCGARIERNKYGDTTDNGTGWEIDHIKAQANGGGDEIGNLQPMQWQNNNAKSDSDEKVCVVPAKK